MIGFALFSVWATLGLHTADHYWAGLRDPCPHTYVAAVVDGGSPLAGNFILPSGDCIIWVNASDGPFRSRQLCKLIVHEAGHLRGLRHSTNPRSVMYPQPTRVPAGCRGVHGPRGSNGKDSPRR